MPLSLRSRPWGLTSQLLNITLSFLPIFLVIFLLVYGLGSVAIHYFIATTEDQLAVHRLKDLLFCISTLFCLCLYSMYVLHYLNQQRQHILELMKAIHYLKDGNCDIPVQIQGNNELSHLANHLEELRLSMVHQKEEEHQQREKELRLVTSISHDLRTPLTSLTGYLEILQDPDFQDENKKNQYLAYCLQRSRQLESLINETFEHFYLSEKELSHVGLLRCNSWSNIASIIESGSVLLQQKGFHCITALPEFRYSLVYDAKLMERLFDNLFANIIRYADKKEAVLITATQNIDKLCITLKNTMNSPQRRHKSTGIGLRNCRSIMELHKGSFSFSAEEYLFSSVICFPLYNRG